jgi:predicted TIM-barrel fold metal-dependent hydrolase
MVVDVNAFVGKWPYWPVPFCTPEAIVAKLSQWGIDRACVCSTRSLFVNWEDGNREIEAVIAQHPSHLVPFACLGTFETSHHVADQKHDLRAYQERGFRAIRLYPQHHSYHLLFESFIDEICEQATALHMPVVLPLRAIMNWGVPALELQDMLRIVERHPRVAWILSGINYLHEIRSAQLLLRRYQSVHLETSCVMGYESIQKIVNECGYEQILFGSAAPLQHGRAGLDKILHARVCDGAREAILSGNAKRLLGLGDQ